LIALSINNWNEERKDKLRAKSHLEELKAELLYDLTRWEDIMIYFEMADEAGLYLNEFLSGYLELVDTIKLKESYLRAGHLTFFAVTDVAYNNLISSSDIKHIENDSIKRMLGLLHSDDEWSKKYLNEGMIDIYNTYHNYIVKHADPLMVRQDVQNNDELLRATMASPSQSFDNLSIKWEDVKHDSTYRMILNQVVANRIIQRMNYLRLKKDMTEIIEIIEKELNKK
jgi:hypothetical protein